MTKNECRNWLINIENSAAAVESKLGSAVVKSVFERYGAHSIKNLNPCYFPDVFSELYAIEVDLDYATLSVKQLAELTVWYTSWLKVTETKTIPEKPEWLE